MYTCDTGFLFFSLKIWFTGRVDLLLFGSCANKDRPYLPDLDVYTESYRIEIIPILRKVK